MAAAPAVAAGRAAAARAQVAQQPARAGAPAQAAQPVRRGRCQGRFQRRRATGGGACALCRCTGRGRYARTVADRWHQLRPHGADAPAAVPGDLRAGPE
ncbi:hypothetical protein G6F22_021555 [Rhizopus arrhizus]|nr:hypothetical protein G6F22_021555 [Rhizopus arrhizus]